MRRKIMKQRKFCKAQRAKKMKLRKNKATSWMVD